MFQADTSQKVAGLLPLLKELSTFILCDLTEAFDFASMADFLLKNENLFICLAYNENIPLSSGYKEIVESLIVKIVETPPKRIPHITFPGFENSIYYNDYQKLFKLGK
uniref:Uncharacterized protein n=1 Tax=Panagrolaimus superbus TaxID=310955 RepID=A0A914XUK6_9BILA